MTPVSLYFNLKDIFLAPRIALSGKKIWIFVIIVLGNHKKNKKSIFYIFFYGATV